MGTEKQQDQDFGALVRSKKGSKNRKIEKWETFGRRCDEALFITGVLWPVSDALRFVDDVLGYCARDETAKKVMEKYPRIRINASRNNVDGQTSSLYCEIQQTDEGTAVVFMTDNSIVGIIQGDDPHTMEIYYRRRDQFKDYSVCHWSLEGDVKQIVQQKGGRKALEMIQYSIQDCMIKSPDRDQNVPRVDNVIDEVYSGLGFDVESANEMFATTFVNCMDT